MSDFFSHFEDQIPERNRFEEDASYAKRIREVTGLGVMHTARIVKKDRILRAIENAEDLNDIKNILKEMVNK